MRHHREVATPMLTLQPLQHLESDDDVSFVRADAHQPVLLMNAGHTALRVLDINQMSERVIDLSNLVDEFLIYAWLVDRDGRCSLLISADKLDFGIGIDHQRWTPFRFELPPAFPHLANVCWTDPALRVIDVRGMVWTSEDGHLAPASAEVQTLEPQCSQAVLARRYAILSHDWETGDTCILDGEDNQVGVVTQATGARAMVDGTGAEIGAAHYRGHLFVCLSEGVDVVFDGERRRLLQPEPGRQMFGIEIGPWRGGSYLAVVSGSMNARARPASVVDIYAIRM